MTNPRSRRTFAWRWSLPAGLMFAALLTALSEPAGRAAPKPAPRPAAEWPKTTPADRLRSENNLKQIGLAMHNYEASIGSLPAPALRGKDGKALLSWRVEILPYIEELGLYMQFKLDEAWDSPHNKKLLGKMPKTYGLPGMKVKPEHGTFYRVFTGPDAPFSLLTAKAAAGPRFLDFTDGTSNTLMVVEAGEAVLWTKPDELIYDAKKPVPKLGGLFPEGFHAAVADGSVRYIDRKIPESDLRALITPQGGEVVDWNKIPLATPPATKE